MTVSVEALKVAERQGGNSWRHGQANFAGVNDVAGGGLALQVLLEAVRLRAMAGRGVAESLTSRGISLSPSATTISIRAGRGAPKLVDEGFEVVGRLRSEGVTVLLIEQNVDEALEVADRAYARQTCRIVLEGTGDELLSHDGVRKAYLGGS